MPDISDTNDEQLEALKRKREVEDLKWLVAHAQGRRIAWRLLEEAGVYRTSFNTNSMTMALNEGKRHLGLFLLAELTEAAPDAYLKMMQEHRSD